ncbi:hypothetical protein M9H77_15749 [Catharanthus roseus]|uniref:Uncharacterized protein n=1 Tax=Catharanthus roseus TaxID=4058 RepID=A0ACC0B130_CATRO|nr:hypothetical protein M9H77_15749 [Catharanthus roseus]
MEESVPSPTTAEHSVPAPRTVDRSVPDPTTVEHRTHGSKPTESIKDVVLWRKKNQSILVILVATALYVALEVYQFNFLAVTSWVAMFVVTVLFLSGNIHRLLAKEAPDMSRMEMSEKTATEMAYTVKEVIEEGFRWLLRVGAERDLFAFGLTIGSLWLLSFIAGRFDLLTFLFTGVMLGMSVPVIYVKYEHKIKEYGWRIKMQSQRCLGVIEEKLKKLKSRVTRQKVVIKEKKTE